MIPKIEWQKVTWYSRWLSIAVVFIFIPIVAFKVGAAYSRTKAVLETRQNVLTEGLYASNNEIMASSSKHVAK